MDDNQKSRMYELLKTGLEKIESGEDIPLEWIREISNMASSEKKECEIVYDGKEMEEKIIAETIVVPFQEVSTFGQQDDLWRNMLIFGDNLQAMKQLLRMKEKGKLINADGTPGVRLVYIDPPFATKREFQGSNDQNAYQDKIAGAMFLEFLRKRLIFLRELLSEDGSIYVHLDYRKGHYVKVLMDEIFEERNFVNEIIWHYDGPQRPSDYKFSTKHATILRYSKGQKPLVNELYFYEKIPENEASFYKDENGRYYYIFPKGSYSEENIEKLRLEGRIYTAKNGKIRIKYFVDKTQDGYFLKKKKISDVWNITSLGHGQPTEKTDYPTQKPEALLERIIKASSNPGDLVLDCFAGSGTTLAVAEKLNRRWIGIDSSKFAIYTIQKRLFELRSGIGNKGDPITPKAFTLYNAGLYDFDKLKKLPWEDWRFFALQLFGCRDEPHWIKGFKMDGRKQGASVYVFNHFDGKQIDHETIEQIHASIGNAVGEKCFIIAPRGSFLFQEDYIAYDHVRYYALRIPYSFIHELHRREFSALIQPKDEKSINAAIDAIGFDFIQAPDIEIRTTKDSHGIKIKIKIERFETKARIRGEEKQSGFEALSMVLVDLDYNGQVFDLDKAFYAKDLKSQQWTIEFSLDACKDAIMLIVLDIYGNESRIRIETNHLQEDLPCQS